MDSLEFISRCQACVGNSQISFNSILILTYPSYSARQCPLGCDEKKLCNTFIQFCHETSFEVISQRAQTGRIRPYLVACIVYLKTNVYDCFR